MPMARPSGSLAAVGILAAVLGCGGPERPLRLATTTSVENSGLMEVLVRTFQQETGLSVQVISVGSGKAMRLARNGDADLILVHDPDGERTLLGEGRISLYRKIMFNRFLIVGPPSDPAGIGKAKDARDALSRIGDGGALFVSRGDGSGTHAREQILWKGAGKKPQRDRLIDTGQGMAATLRVASERAAYCLTDEATFFQLHPTLRLENLFDRDTSLLNTYAVMVVGQTDRRRESAAERLARWLADGDGRRVIASFTVNGHAPFTAWPVDAARDAPQDLPGEPRS
jgi:tungstate transport system substrate-binding protein